MRFAAALGLFVAIATAVCPLRLCFGHDEEGTVPAAPGNHGHDDHEGPDRNAGCCTDVPTETGGPWFVVHLNVPSVASSVPPVTAPQPPHASPPADAPHADAVRTTVLLR
ncbi:MAG TPA: hypothetical protein VFY93_14705 [Planctomycetota bacterium]|nr:hypothetical protein [Planctomycetota bacterium]